MHRSSRKILDVVNGGLVIVVLALIVFYPAWSSELRAQDSSSPQTFVLTVHENLLSLQAREASLTAILTQIGRELAIDVVAHLPMDETITVAFDRLPVVEALQKLSTNYAYIVDSVSGDKSITKIIVVSKGKATSRPSASTPSDAQPTDATRSIVSRVNGIAALRRKLNATDAPETQLQDGEQRSVVHATYDTNGYVTGLWAFSHEGLMRTSKDEKAEETFWRFLSENAPIFDFRDRSPETIAASSGLHLSHSEETSDPTGKIVTTLEYRQQHHSLDIIDGTVTAIFWDDRLTSVVGPIISPDDPIGDKTVMLDEQGAAERARNEASKRAGREMGVLPRSFGLELSSGRIVYVFRAMPISAASTAELSFGHVYTVKIDGETGNVVDWSSDQRHFNSVETSYKVYKPQPTAATPDVQDVATVTGYAALDQGWLYPWQDELADRSPVPTYDTGVRWPGYGLGFEVRGYLDGGFVQSPGTSAFAQQHASYWAQRAARVADINFYWWPPANASNKYRKVTVVSPCGGGGAAAFNPVNCWDNALWRKSDETACICAQAMNGFGYPDQSAARIHYIFHEYGHAVDWKYGWNSRTGAEGQSLSEAVAMLYAMMMFVHEFGTSTNFTQYNAAPINGQPSLHWFMGDAVGTYVHRENNQNLLCYKHPSLPLSDDTKYAYAGPLAQAVWESIHGLNCGSTPCFVMNDGAGADQARWALFYAIKNSGSSGTYPQFVHNFLTYYYYSVGYNQWNNRWWVFNHHRLVGPNYGYSPCHSY